MLKPELDQSVSQKTEKPQQGENSSSKESIVTSYNLKLIYKQQISLVNGVMMAEEKKGGTQL